MQVSTSKFHLGFWYGPAALCVEIYLPFNVPFQKSSCYINCDLNHPKHNVFPTYRCQQTQFQIANVLADMAEMKLQEKEQQEAFQAAPMPKGLQFFMRGLAKKTS